MADSPEKTQEFNATTMLYRAMREIWPQLPEQALQLDISMTGPEPFPVMTVRHFVDGQTVAPYAKRLSRFRLVPIDSVVLPDTVAPEGAG